MLSDDEYAQAVAILLETREFEWLTNSDKKWYSLGEVSDNTGVSRDSIRKWCEAGDFPGAINYQPIQVGWRIPKSNLVVFFARALRRKSESVQDIA